MSMTDPVADMLTRVRNANMVGHERVEIPASKLKMEITRTLHEEGYIRNYRWIDDSQTRCFAHLFEIWRRQRKGYNGTQEN